LGKLPITEHPPIGVGVPTKVGPLTNEGVATEAIPLIVLDESGVAEGLPH